MKGRTECPVGTTSPPLANSARGQDGRDWDHGERRRGVPDVVRDNGLVAVVEAPTQTVEESGPKIPHARPPWVTTPPSQSIQAVSTPTFSAVPSGPHYQ